jgi:ABC-type glutathione transport system ATPase component
MALLDVRITARYRGGRPVLNDVQFSVKAGEAFGLIGESGAGKSTVVLAILNLLDWAGGEVTGYVRFNGQDLLAMPEPALRRIRGREIGFVPQSALASLNPALCIGAHFREAWDVHHRRDMPHHRVFELLKRVNLPATPDFLKRRPRELSVGMAQRVAIALALLHGPSLLVADEPSSALDPVTQAEIMSLFRSANADGMALLYISHDLPSVAALCSRAAIIKEGRIVESGPCSEVLRVPTHEYSRRLVESIPAWPA